MSDRMRRWIKWIGYPLFAVFAFLFFFYLSLPCEKIKAKATDFIATSFGVLVEIGDLAPRPLFGASLKRVLIKEKPKVSFEDTVAVSSKTKDKKEAKKALQLVIDEATVKTGLFGIFSLLAGGVDISFSVSSLGGELDGDFEMDKKKGWRLKGEISKINIARLPVLEELIGLPLAGQLSAKLDIHVPEDRWSLAAGRIDLDCEDCTVGDGKAKLKMRGDPMMEQGVTIPKIRLGRFGGQIKIEKGLATPDLSIQSPDIELNVEGSLSLRSPLPYSYSQIYLRFKISPEFKKQNIMFELLEGKLANAKRPDGFIGYQLIGQLNSIHPAPSSGGPNRLMPPGRRPYGGGH
jgi:type II secretion system protein N